MRVAGFGIRVRAVCVVSLIFYSTFNGATVVGVGGAIALGKGDVAGSEVAYSVVSV